MVKKLTGGILIPKMFNIVYLFFTLFVFIGGYSIYFYNDEFPDKDIALKATIGIILTMYLLPLGYFISKFLQKKTTVNSRRSFTNIYPGEINKKGLFLIVCIILYSCYLYYSSLNSIPILSVFDNSLESKYELAELRSNATNNLQYNGKSYIFKLLVGYRDFIQITLLSLVTGFFLLKYKHNKSSVNLLIFMIFLLLLLFNSVSALKKADIIFVVLFLYFVNSYDNYKRNTRTIIDKHKIIKLSLLGTISFVMLIALYSLFMKIPLNNIGMIISSIFERIFISSIKPLYFYFGTFPGYHDFLMGKSFTPTMFAGILNYDTFKIEQYIFSIMSPHIIDREIIGTAPTVFIAELYANFGYLPMILGIVLVGAIIGYLEGKLENLRYSYLNISFYIILAFTIKDISISSIQSVVGFPTIISKVLIFLLLTYILLFPNKKTKKPSINIQTPARKGA